jgi:ABC-type glycerol-3-phosphate transport system permease component
MNTPSSRSIAEPTPKVQRDTRRWPRPAQIVHYGILLLLLIFSFALVALMVALSLRPSVLIYVNFWALPLPPTWENYQEALLALLPAMWRSLWVTIVSIVGILLIAAPASYAVARISFPGKNLFFAIVLAVLTVPGIILLAPLFVLAEQLGLRGSLWGGLVLFYVAAGLPGAIFLITTFFQSQPLEIFEAAKIDGASELQSLLRIAVPLAIPILVTVAIFNFLGIYGDYIWPTLMLRREQATLLMALAQYNPQVSEFATRPDLGAQTAGYTFATLPQLILFAFGMRYFIQGVTSGAIKG